MSEFPDTEHCYLRHQRQRTTEKLRVGVRVTVLDSLFNPNQGGIAIADAQWQQAVRQYVTVRDQVTLDVRSAHTQLVQASENLNAVRREILPALQRPRNSPGETTRTAEVW